MLVGIRSYLYQVGGIGLLTLYDVEAKKARKGYCFSKGKKDYWRCKKKAISAPSPPPTSAPTASPTSAPTSAPTGSPTSALIELNDDNIGGAVKEWFNNEQTAKTKYGNIEDWDVTRVTKMSYLFISKDSFNGDISGWDISKVTDISGMFYNAKSFNGDLSGWNTEKMIDTQYLFNGAASFKGNVSGWDISKVTQMTGMFKDAISFNVDLSGWNTEKAEVMSVSSFLIVCYLINDEFTFSLVFV